MTHSAATTPSDALSGELVWVEVHAINSQLCSAPWLWPATPANASAASEHASHDAHRRRTHRQGRTVVSRARRLHGTALPTLFCRTLRQPEL